MNNNKLSILFSLTILLSLLHLQVKAEAGCWLSSYGRGIGEPLSACPDGHDKDGALCYPICSNNFTGSGSVCWQNCPSNFIDTGIECLKPPSYRRGTGYIPPQQSKCESENPQGCERYGLLYYPKCADGFTNAGSCVCSPKCLEDTGKSCQKNAYLRDDSTPLICPAGLQKDADLCYAPCNIGFSGKGPVCWGSCPVGMYQCGALCLGSQDECTSEMLDIGLKAMEGVSKVGESTGAVISAAETMIGIADDLDYPLCPHWAEISTFDV